MVHQPLAPRMGCSARLQQAGRTASASPLAREGLSQGPATEWIGQVELLSAVRGRSRWQLTPTTPVTECRDGSQRGNLAWTADRAGALACGSQDRSPAGSPALDGPDHVILSREALHDG